MPLSTNNINLYNKPKTQVVKKRFLGFVRKVEHKMVTPKNINRENQFGLAKEKIDFFEGSSKIQKHYREFTPRKGNASRKTTVEFLFEGAKKIIREKYSNRLNQSEPVLESNTRNYMQGKKLASKAREYSGADHGGVYEAKITTTYDPEYNPKTEKPKLVSVFNEKRYVKKNYYAKSSDHYEKTTILFDNNGKKAFERKETPQGWISREFDENGVPGNKDSGDWRLSYENYSENLI